MLVALFISTAIIIGCKQKLSPNQINTYKTKTDSNISCTVNDDSYDRFLANSDISKLLKHDTLYYESLMNNGPVYDSFWKENRGYIGSVDISHLNRKGFDFDVDVWEMSISGGHASGKAQFDTLNRAHTTCIDNMDTPHNCRLIFYFVDDSLILEEKGSDCLQLHGYPVQLEDVYVLGKGQHYTYE